ncbi:carboxymuconolactone decarboxylase family protein [Edaphobacter sp. 12200R-103]|uniref:carboxymuconolactone decarboxylase family protein n=1 Tax=Edaphobacter sp. 12200R-103 TaxID=2703788 RepID=UPI00138B6C5B|nr:carboxymuconolactone decarboxylase family protein [Edaphobacter sp. 12200R-103]QHS50964.1 carboxymuconolactone decarboxylase family protein [Edaphobacter sp. 12200R-103]
MSNARIRYWDVAPGGMAKLRELEHYLNAESGLDYVLRELVKLRASQLNGCDLCVRTHAEELQKAGASPEKIEDAAEWRNSSAYTLRERAALSWAEVITNIQDGHALEAVYREMRAAFTEVEVVNLTLVIATINAWNRLAIALGKQAGIEVQD